MFNVSLDRTNMTLYSPVIETKPLFRIVFTCMMSC